MMPTTQAVTRFTRALIPLLAFLLFPVQRSQAANAFTVGGTDPTFLNGMYGAHSPLVNVIEIDRTNGFIYIGGRFVLFNGQPHHRFLRLNLDGSPDQTFNDKILGPNLDVFGLALQTNGQILVAGKFNNIKNETGNAINPHKGLLRMNADGSIDQTFNRGPGINQGPGPDLVSCNEVIVQPDGKIVVSGTFNHWTGDDLTLVAADTIVRLNEDGTVDTSFSTGSGFTSSSGFPVDTIRVQADGKLLVGGQFTSVQGTPQGAIARLNANGTLDTTFNSGGAGFEGTIRDIAFLDSGKIIVAGDMRKWNGADITRIVRLNSDGTLDPTFGVGLTVNNEIRSVNLTPDGKLLLTGVFEIISGVSRPGACRLNADGTLDLTFDPLAGTDKPANDAALDTFFDLVIVGEFPNWNGVTNFTGITRLSTGVITNRPPLIVSNPVSLTVTNGNPAAFSVTASGTGPLSYQWKKNGVAIPGQTATTLSFAAAQVSDQASYKVCVTNSGGQVESAEATLTVILPASPPVIVAEPQSQIVKENTE